MFKFISNMFGIASDLSSAARKGSKSLDKYADVLEDVADDYVASQKVLRSTDEYKKASLHEQFSQMEHWDKLTQEQQDNAINLALAQINQAKSQ